MKKTIIVIFVFLSYLNAKSQDFTPYYEKSKDYKSKYNHRYQFSTNTRLIYRDIPLIFEMELPKDKSFGMSIGFMPARSYKYVEIGEGSKYIPVDKLALTYGLMFKSWSGAESFEGLYKGVSLQYTNIPDFRFVEGLLIFGGNIALSKLLFIDISFGFGLKYRIDYDSSLYEFRTTFAGKLELGFGFKIK